ncbi:MAG: AmmeMemoRadiSam system protein B, partial [Anaerolineae bacterium]
RVADMLESAPFYTSAPRAHEPEHCLEVEVPFLQMSLASFELVPMLFGQVEPGEVATDLIDRVGDEDLIVVSSDLSHFHAYDMARQRDQDFLNALLEGDETGVRTGEACGRAPAMTLMEIAERESWAPHLLDYRNSGDTAGDKSRVVGYASIAYTT